MGLEVEEPPPGHPAADQAWFRALPDEHRERMHDAWRSGLARMAELRRGRARATRRGALQIATVFGVFDLMSPGVQAPTLLLLLGLGAAFGALCARVRADHNVYGGGGLVLFWAAEWWTRGGLSALHLFWLVVVGCLCGLCGLANEDD